ncbi:hypothetical protein C0989_008025 [Termitomyces sp. Mn162]|nr:hypothetical protein C0989_008025 [Termitomyces sp. Mn162]
MVTSKGEKDVEMRETTPSVTVAKVEHEASNMEVEGKEEFKAAPVAIEEEKDEVTKGTKVQQRWTWSNMPLCQVGNNELEWLGENLAWLTPLTPAMSLVDFDERAAGVEQWFQRELEVAREELVVARAWYTVAK